MAMVIMLMVIMRKEMMVMMMWMQQISEKKDDDDHYDLGDGTDDKNNGWKIFCAGNERFPNWDEAFESAAEKTKGQRKTLLRTY